MTWANNGLDKHPKTFLEKAPRQKITSFCHFLTPIWGRIVYYWDKVWALTFVDPPKTETEERTNERTECMYERN